MSTSDIHQNTEPGTSIILMQLATSVGNLPQYCDSLLETQYEWTTISIYFDEQCIFMENVFLEYILTFLHGLVSLYLVLDQIFQPVWKFYASNNI